MNKHIARPQRGRINLLVKFYSSSFWALNLLPSRVHYPLVTSLYTTRHLYMMFFCLRRCLLVATALININAAAGPLPLVSPSYAPARLEMRGGEPYTNQVVRVGFQDTQGHWRDTYSNGDAIVLFVGEYDTFAVAQNYPKNMALLLLHPPSMTFRDVRAPAAAEVRRMTELRISVTFEGYKEKKAVLDTLRDINELKRTTSLKFSNDLEYFEIILERLHSLEREGLDVFEVTGDGKGWEDVRRTVASARGY
ncbi:hypothetical protein GG344DRAFT_83137 [Lentinula edodes]|nr:hypothetical protein GG344DRAFT_83137 [Lentinula edodes]